MDPFGLIQSFILALEAVAEAAGLKPRRHARRERAWFIVVYVLLMIAGVAAVVMVVRQLYFAR